MRLLVDQDVYRVTIEVLEKWGHDVATAKQFGMQRASDEELLKKAQETGRLLITRDKDFGTLVFLREEIATGVIFLRIAPRIITEVHAELQRLFNEHKEEELMRLFCVVEPHRHRIRHLECRS